MTSKLSVAALLALGTLAVAGAGAADARPRAAVDTGANHSLDSLNQPIVQHVEFVLDLAGSYDGVAAPELARLDAWFRSLDLGYGDHVWVDTLDGSGRARHDVARVASDYGLLVSDGAPVIPGRPQPGAVRVIVSRAVASVPGCPKWRNSEGPSVTSANYGCATNSNLAAMVADPNDLVLGQTGSNVGDPLTASKAIRTYRDTAPTGSKGLLENSTTSGGH